MTDQQTSTAKAVIAELNKVGITNPFLVAGILAVIYKESAFIPKAEMSYKNTSNARLRTIFSKLKTAADSDIDTLKADDTAFFNFIYGNKLGNNNTTDGVLYRGRGLNQITFKDLYKKYGDEIGVDLVSNPDQLNDPTIAAQVAAHYFIDVINTGIKNSRLNTLFGVSSIDDINTADKGLLVAFQANAGLGTSLNTAFFKQSIIDTKAKLKEIADALGTGTAGTLANSVIPLLAVGSWLIYMLINYNKA